MVASACVSGQQAGSPASVVAWSHSRTASIGLRNCAGTASTTISAANPGDGIEGLRTVQSNYQLRSPIMGAVLIFAWDTLSANDFALEKFAWTLLSGALGI